VKKVTLRTPPLTMLWHPYKIGSCQLIVGGRPLQKEKSYCPTREMGENPSPLGEDFGSIFCAARVRGVEDSRVRE
ncbi:MAG: hypothetical protein ABII26_03505, partial [Pseudomonadota bacterium]